MVHLQVQGHELRGSSGERAEEASVETLQVVLERAGLGARIVAVWTLVGALACVHSQVHFEVMR